MTEADWSKVFTVRCKSKRGTTLTKEEQALVERAFRSDPKRYRGMEARVFNETVPVGSNARMKEPEE